MGTIGNSVFTHASQINVNSYYHICLLQFFDDKLLNNYNILETNRTNFHTGNVLTFIFLEGKGLTLLIKAHTLQIQQGEISTLGT